MQLAFQSYQLDDVDSPIRLGGSEASEGNKRKSNEVMYPKPSSSEEETSCSEEETTHRNSTPRQDKQNSSRDSAKTKNTGNQKRETKNKFDNTLVVKDRTPKPKSTVKAKLLDISSSDSDSSDEVQCETKGDNSFIKLKDNQEDKISSESDFKISDSDEDKRIEEICVATIKPNNFSEKPKVAKRKPNSDPIKLKRDKNIGKTKSAKLRESEKTVVESPTKKYKDTVNGKEKVSSKLSTTSNSPAKPRKFNLRREKNNESKKVKKHRNRSSSSESSSSDSSGSSLSDVSSL